MNFSNFPFLRELDLSGNAIELVIPNAFLNSTQLQKINLSGNKLENLDSNIFRVCNFFIHYMAFLIFDYKCAVYLTVS